MCACIPAHSFFYDVSVTPNFQLTYLWFMQSTFLCALGTPAIDTLFYAVASNLSAHLRVIQRRAKYLQFDVVGYRRALRDLILYHQRIIHHTEYLTKTFQPILLVHFTVSSVQICVIAYQLSLVSATHPITCDWICGNRIDIDLCRRLVKMVRPTARADHANAAHLCDISGDHRIPVLRLLSRRHVHRNGERRRGGRSVRQPLVHGGRVHAAMRSHVHATRPAHVARALRVHFGEFVHVGFGGYCTMYYSI